MKLSTMAPILKLEPTDTGGGAETVTGQAQQPVPDSHTALVHSAIRIHKDGLMRGTYKAIAIAPSRIFVDVDPLSYPIDSRLEIEFIAENSQGAAGYRLPATVSRRSLNGIELRLQPGQVS